jgi:WD40 repeat protein
MVSFDDEYAKIWDLLTGRSIGMLAFKQSARVVALSSKYQMLFAAVGQYIWGYDISKSNVLKPLAGHRGEIVSLSIQGDIMVSAAVNGSVCIWDLSSLECIQKYHIRQNITAAKTNSDKSILIIAYEDNAVAWDCRTGKLLDKITLSQYIPNMIEIGDAKIITCSNNGIVTIKKIADNTFSLIIRNELSEPIENFELLDYGKCKCSKPFSCSPHQHVAVSVNTKDSFNRWYIRFMCNGEVLSTLVEAPLVSLREIALTYAIKSGAILASIVPWEEKKRFLQLFYQTKFPIPSDKDDLDLSILTVGKPIKQIALTDSKGGRVNAKKDFLMQAQWSIHKAHHYAPYELCARTKDGIQYQWQLPFLCNSIEAMLSLPETSQTIKRTPSLARSDSYSEIPPARMRSLSTSAMSTTEGRILNISRKPILALYEEFSAQEYRVPGCLQYKAAIEDLHMITEQVH